MEDNYEKLANDFDSFRTYFNQHKKCECPIDECVEFDIALVQVFGDRTEKLMKKRIEFGIKTFMEIFYP